MGRTPCGRNVDGVLMATGTAADTTRLMRTLVESAVLAPSSHNTQPWRFRLTGGRLELRADRSRSLPVNDPHDRELTISCGAAWLNVRVAAGDALRSRLLPDPRDPDLLAAATVPGGAPPDDALAQLAEAIPQRHTHRRAFSDREVPPPLLAELDRAAAVEGARLELLRDDDQRRALVALVAEGDRRQFADPRWRRELASWMHSRRRGEGLTMPLAAVPVNRLVVSSFDLGGRVGTKDATLVTGTAPGTGSRRGGRCRPASSRPPRTGCKPAS